MGKRSGGDNQNLTAGFGGSNEPFERSWSHPWQSDMLPASECIHPAASPPRSPENSQAPTLRVSIEEEALLTLQSGVRPLVAGEVPKVTAGEPMTVQCRFSTALKSELARPVKLPVDKRYRRKAFLVALDTEMLRHLGRGRGVNAKQAAKLKPLARQCQCCKKVEIFDQCEVELCLFPQHFPGGIAQVLLQVVVESSVDKTYWACFGNMAPVTVVPGKQDVRTCSECFNTGRDVLGNQCPCGNFDGDATRYPGSDGEAM